MIEWNQSRFCWITREIVRLMAKRRRSLTNSQVIPGHSTDVLVLVAIILNS